ncbi:MAG: hypothetical protein QOJ93_280, partial [Actinomycetota bacterium]|nr:hypothetical protein [Actinomycetota bacterium]
MTHPADTSWMQSLKGTERLQSWKRRAAPRVANLISFLDPRRSGPIEEGGVESPYYALPRTWEGLRSVHP